MTNTIPLAERLSFVPDLSKRSPGYHHIVLDGIIDEESTIHIGSSPWRSAHIKHPEVASRLFAVSLHELSLAFSRLALPVPQVAATHESLHDVTFVWKRFSGTSLDQMFFPISTNPYRWVRPWSIADYYDRIAEASRDYSDLSLADSNEASGHLTLAADFLDDRTLPALTHLTARLPSAVALVSQAESVAAASVRSDAVVSYFHFPSSISVACQQYLLYFVQFLEDLGIEAKADVTQEPSRVLFTVTPANGPEALEAIREALDAYLKLPGSVALSQIDDQGSDTAVLQLKSNVLHLQSQLMLAVATIRTHEATIEAMSLSTYRYRQLLMSTDRQRSVAAADESPKQREPLIEGVVTVTKYEGKGFEIELPQLLRRLKRVFGLKPRS
jgi:hypothetical protein